MNWPEEPASLRVPRLKPQREPESGGSNKRAARSDLQDCCLLLLRVSRHRLHYTAIARLIREQTSLTPTDRQVIAALRVLASEGIVTRTSRGVYESTTDPSPTERRSAA